MCILISHFIRKSQFHFARYSRNRKQIKFHINVYLYCNYMEIRITSHYTKLTITNSITSNMIINFTKEAKLECYL